MELDEVDRVGNGTPPPPEDKSSERSKGKTTAKPTAGIVGETGKSLLPISRVQKIMKADKVSSSSHFTCKTSSLMSFQELPIVAKEAAFLISLATEEFIKRLSEASHHIAHREKRVTVQQRDIGAIISAPQMSTRIGSSDFNEIASVTRRADEFLFLEGENQILSETIIATGD